MGLAGFAFLEPRSLDTPLHVNQSPYHRGMLRALLSCGRTLPLAGVLLAGALAAACRDSSPDPETPPPATRAPLEIRALPTLSVTEARAAIEAFQSAGIDPALATRVTIPGECGGPGYPTLEEAVAGADAIVVGRVTSVEFLFDGETRELARLEVEEVIRGNAGQLYVLNIAGGPRGVGGELALTQHQTNPLLLTGDRGLFLLQRMSLTAAFVPQGFSGQFRFGSDRVETVLGNPFASKVEVMGQTEFVRLVRKLAR